MEDYSNTVIKDLEEKKQKKIDLITKMNNKKYKEIKTYYNDITASNLSMIKQLKAEIDNAQQTEEKDKKQLLKAEDTNKKLIEPISQINNEIEKLKSDRQQWEQVKEKKSNFWQKIETLEKKYRDLEYEFEIKLQQFQYLEQEYELMKKNYDKKIFEVLQKSGFYNLILERELKLLSGEIEKKDLHVK